MCLTNGVTRVLQNIITFAYTRYGAASLSPHLGKVIINMRVSPWTRGKTTFALGTGTTARGGGTVLGRTLGAPPFRSAFRALARLRARRGGPFCGGGGPELGWSDGYPVAGFVDKLHSLVCRSRLPTTFSDSCSAVVVHVIAPPTYRVGALTTDIPVNTPLVSQRARDDQITFS